MSVIPRDVLEALDAEVLRAFETWDTSRLVVLGYGEISSVVRCDVGGESFACKRLPPFDGPARVAAYRACFDKYLDQLAACGVNVVDSQLEALDAPDGGVTVWCIQPMLPADGLLPKCMRGSEDDALAIVERVLDAIMSTASPRLGLDGQLSNWAWADGDLHYLDVTTPMMRDADGRDELDADLFLASLPWPLRAVVRRLLLRDIIDTYHQPRTVIRDLLANLFKERLDHLLTPMLERANTRLDERITRKEIETYYGRDAKIWGGLQTLRRADRAWQRHVAKRTYPFLLPGPIDR